ncbi:MAG: MFS transporter, partial [bacterium]|nr:MFS transporter [bacterium]
LFPFIAGLVEMSAMFGASLSAYTLAKPVKMFGWRYTMLGCAFVGILIFVYSAIFIKKDRIFKSTKDTPPSILKNLFFLIKNKNMWLCGIFAGICFSPILSIATLWGIPFFVEKYHSTLNVASSFTATIFIGVAIGNPLIGYFATKFNIYKPTMLAGIVINIVLISLLLYLPNFSNFSVTIISLFIGISSSIYVIPFIIVKEQFPIEICSTAMALTNVLCGFLGTIIFQPLLGKVITICRAMNIAEVNSYECALSLIPLALILGLILIFFIKSSIQERERA